ncbi:hypothetical protein RhiirB3_445132 [Rhizophagus irregularis]|nr:hypothetical protein RhiirB3_445132 [Rhizophagus irregularis]
MLSQKSNKVLCTCSKCKQQDTEQGIGLLISKSARTRHRKKEKETPVISDSSLSLSSFSIHENWTNMVDRGDDECNFTDVENELTSDSPTNESSDSEDSLENMSDFDEELSDEMSCALKLLDIKSHCNITDDAFHQIMVAINNNVTLHQAKKKLKSIVKIESILVDMCPNSCCAYTGNFNKYYNECNYCHESRFQIEESNQKYTPRCQMAYFSIKDRLIIQYQDSRRSAELMYRANYTQHQDFGFKEKIGDIFDGKRYQKLLSYGFFCDDRDIALLGSIDGYQIFQQKTNDCWTTNIREDNVGLCHSQSMVRMNLLMPLQLIIV